VNGPPSAAWPHFCKVEGLGNDFVLVDLRAEPDPPARAERLARDAAALCDRRRGVGADGLLLVLPAPGGVRMRVVNRDGSVPEMCGNGLRCVALFVAAGAEPPAPVHVETDAGPRPCTVVARTGASGVVRAAMGPVRLGPTVRPAAARGLAGVVVDVGNPHVVFSCDADEDPRTLARTLGPAVERDPAFPAGTNVEFVRIDTIEGDRAAVTCAVWERGCGITEACGTGACAAAGVVARTRGVEAVEVTLPGGALAVSFDDGVHAHAEGPARLVFEGRWHGDPAP